uniref:Uncharacterized protein n=1 Tax=Aureoumbra lagunensis TaxID=44058 RepID=A0A7S3JYS4_9STRA|mmetsp:Transcript_21904/g.33743  ORF Transcript_21904/g.33743 Transcript_21904/m.33743 type:complete len:609 (+) Transcript_21904:73-1899(+)|eukprot:CAMPEP_0197317432 /NCGR_PEP_ID=MMETSP0891-20130614/47039_1 /TAXON_ID=44058 ORGANISM="Aureoumbra lagunensis, Strain CCMP1510" /NCGR_SAMPLE_ID=MMETSP0891 /ASSEMBLY_ACC=CAM_ASM_000534 /LENGTH=608 /DNA_ID=CAMNT_0042807429 /DNA_START=57 /DNA_END=1883 /DNA_ORIENTATION=+
MVVNGEEEDQDEEKTSGKRSVRSALARYGRIEKSVLAVSQRAQILLRRAHNLTTEVKNALDAMGNLRHGDALLIAAQVRRQMEEKSKFGPMPTPQEQLQFQQRISETKNEENSLSREDGVKKRPAPLKLDELGREINGDGRVLKKHRTVVSLLANKKIETDAVTKKVNNPYSARKVVDATDTLDDELIDARLVTKRRETRKARGLDFIPEGHYIKVAEATRREGTVHIEHVPDDITTKIDNEIPQKKDDNLLPRRSEHFASIPGMEWWDEPFLPKEIQEARIQSTARRIQKDEYENCAVDNNAFFTLVHHPKMKQQNKPSITIPFYLTKHDRKRIRRQTRAEREREKRDKIQLGLIPPPEPKFKLSNFMQVLGQQAVADPTKLEAKVMAQVNQRLLNHEMRNAARKLTPQERKDKRRRKLQEDTSNGVEVALFYIHNLDNTQHRFKIDVNAQQFNLTGITLLSSSPEARFATIVVEGGPKSIKRYVALICKRIDWGTNNWALCVWRGYVVKRAFHAFRFHECTSTSAARRIFESRSVPHYWDMSLTRHGQGAPGTEDELRFLDLDDYTENDDHHQEDDDPVVEVEVEEEPHPHSSDHDGDVIMSPSSS